MNPNRPAKGTGRPGREPRATGSPGADVPEQGLPSASEEAFPVIVETEDGSRSTVRKSPGFAIRLLPHSWAAALVRWIRRARNPIATRLDRRETQEETDSSESPADSSAVFPTDSRTISPIVSPGETGDPHEQLDDIVRGVVPPWVISLGVHFLLVLLLSLLVFHVPADNSIQLVLKIPTDIRPEPEDPTFQLGGDPQAEEENVDPIEKPSENPVVNPDATPPDATPQQTEGPVVAETERPKFPSPLRLDGRNPGDREARLARGGGGPGTESAVLRGLDWLCTVQRPNGHWSLTGPYADGMPQKQLDNPVAATAMALLAFHGIGVTPETKDERIPKKYVTAVKKGWDWLLLRQIQGNGDDDGCFFREGYGTYTHRFYTHGQCTIALCELYVLTGNDIYREPAQRAVDYCLRHQSVSGGWRYRANAASPESDVSVTGWIVLALQSARAGALEVPEEHFDRIGRFFDSVAVGDGSRYCYNLQETGVTLSMTAEALLCRELLGWPRDDPRLTDGLDWLSLEENLVRYDDRTKRDVYYWYYATQALHHYGGEPWRRWNERMREELPKQQVQSGKERGSWSPRTPVPDEWGMSFGRLYTTCLSILMLESYYRHVPVYETPEELEIP